MSRFAAYTVLLLVAGCSSNEAVESAFNAQSKAEEQAARERAADRSAIQAGFQPAQPGPLATVSVDPPKTSAPGATLPGADRQYRYIGRWAATPAMCRDGAWRFQVRKLMTKGASCELPTVAAVPSGYVLAGTCRAKGVKSEESLRLRFDERLRTMRVAGRTLGPADLIYCGD